MVETENIFRSISHIKKRAFLTAYAQNGNLSQSAEIAGVDRRSHYNWLKQKQYKEAFEVAKEMAGDSLEAEARRRAVEGILEPVFYQGEIVGHVRRYSDSLLMFMLKGVRPEKFQDRLRAEMMGKDGGPIQATQKIDFSSLSDEELKTLERIAEKTTE